MAFRPFGGFQAHLSHGYTPLMEDQSVEVAGQIGECAFCRRTGNADGADEVAQVGAAPCGTAMPAFHCSESFPATRGGEYCPRATERAWGILLMEWPGVVFWAN